MPAVAASIDPKINNVGQPLSTAREHLARMAGALCPSFRRRLISWDFPLRTTRSAISTVSPLSTYQAPQACSEGAYLVERRGLQLTAARYDKLRRYESNGTDDLASLTAYLESALLLRVSGRFERDEGSFKVPSARRSGHRRDSNRACALDSRYRSCDRRLSGYWISHRDMGAARVSPRRHRSPGTQGYRAETGQVSKNLNSLADVVSVGVFPAVTSITFGHGSMYSDRRAIRTGDDNHIVVPSIPKARFPQPVRVRACRICCQHIVPSEC